MALPRFEGDPDLAQELLVGISILAADTLQRSGLLVLTDVTYSSIELTTLNTPDEEINLFIGPDENGNHIVTLSENPRAQDRDDEIFDIGRVSSLLLHRDGSGFAPRFEPSIQDEPFTEAAERIMRRLPDFVGAAATIEVLVEQVK